MIINTTIIVATHDQLLIKLVTPPITAGNNNYDYIELKLDKSWLFDDETVVLKMIFYKKSDDTINVPVENCRCIIPPLLLREAGTIHFGLIAEKDGEIIKTSNPATYVIRPGIEVSGNNFVDWLGFKANLIETLVEKFNLNLSASSNVSEILGEIENAEPTAQLIEAYNLAAQLIDVQMFEEDNPLPKLTIEMTDEQIAERINSAFTLLARVVGYYAAALNGIVEINLNLFSASNIPNSIDLDFSSDLAAINQFVIKLNRQYREIKQSLIGIVNESDEDVIFTEDSADEEIIDELNLIVTDYVGTQSERRNIIDGMYQLYTTQNQGENDGQ